MLIGSGSCSGALKIKIKIKIKRHKRPCPYTLFINGGRAVEPGAEFPKTRLRRHRWI